MTQTVRRGCACSNSSGSAPRGDPDDRGMLARTASAVCGCGSGCGPCSGSGHGPACRVELVQADPSGWDEDRDGYWWDHFRAED